MEVLRLAESPRLVGLRDRAKHDCVEHDLTDVQGDGKQLGHLILL